MNGTQLNQANNWLHRSWLHHPWEQWNICFIRITILGRSFRL